MAREIHSKTILNVKKNRDSWFLDDYTLNPYSACSFNCLYCYIRGSKYGHNMEDVVSVKVNAEELLIRALSAKSKKGKFGIIVLSSSTDPYLQLEKEYELTRKLLKIIHRYRFPVHIITKSDLILRDIDVLKGIDEEAILPQDLNNKGLGGVAISFSFSTIDDKLASIFEPAAPSPSQRLEVMQKLLVQGFKVGVSMMPLLPFLSDSRDSIEGMFQKFKEIGVHYVMPASLTLFGNGKFDSKTLYLNAIRKNFPELLNKTEKLFAKSFSVSREYEASLGKIFNEMGSKFNLPNRIIQ